MVIRPEDVDNFMRILPVRKLFGVGPKMEEKLHALNIKTCADLQQHSVTDLSNRFGSSGQRLYELARGIDNRPVNPNRIRKSISVEETYPKDLSNTQACLSALPALIKRLEERIHRIGAPPSIHSLFVKLKFNDFQQTTVEHTSNQIDLNTLQQLIQIGFLRKNMPVRLLGVGIKLKEKNVFTALQLSLFE